MARERQLSFLSRGPLFDPQVRRQYLADMRTRPIPDEGARVTALSEWLGVLPGAARKETSLEQLFNQRVLGALLGYELWPSAGATAWPKPPASATGMPKEPDVLLGSFRANEEPGPVAVLELKSPDTDFDAPQARESGLTPVEQAFEYGERILGVQWVLVSDMRRIRLYSVESTHESLEFDLGACLDAGRPTDEFRELYFFLSDEALVRGGAEGSSTARLLTKSVSRQLAVRDSFYEAYYWIRADLLAAIEGGATAVLGAEPDLATLLSAVQRLLDRMLFIYYCEDSPERLLPPGTVKRVTESARDLPGTSQSKVYAALKALFREIDEGSPPTSRVVLPGYNGELFKRDPILDEIDLPDDLHDKIYEIDDGERRRDIQGVWGLHAFDFWRELNEHLLGHIFEQSLSDIERLAEGAELSAPDRIGERRQYGIYYTSEILSNYLATTSIAAILAERVPQPEDPDESALRDHLTARQDLVSDLRVIDLACGSGAFLVSSYQVLLEEFWRTRDGLDHLAEEAPNLLAYQATLTQSSLLRDALYGSDLLPQAAEIAKLALWLRSARSGEKIADLSENVVASDSLDVDRLLGLLDQGFGTYDLVIMNPPWGAEIDTDVYRKACERLGLDPEPEWDSWELFVVLGLAFLSEGGRLAFVLPDTIFSPEKERTRRLLLDSGTVEHCHNLGTDWFKSVRMGTVTLQLRRGTVPMVSSFRSILLSGGLRRQAIAGAVPLTQIEAQFGREIPQERCAASPTAEIEIFRSRRDDALMDNMDGHSHRLADLCDRGRGEEMSKAGLLWRCPNCFATTVPGKKRKRDPRRPDDPRYHPKDCPSCGLELTEANTEDAFVIEDTASEDIEGDEVAPYIDGDDIAQRYRIVQPRRVIHLDFEGFSFKPADRYEAPKILIRQAGVGIMATIDSTGARCPQSVYWYRLKPEWAEAGYELEFLLAALLSRTMAYYVFKRFSEVDPARAHAKVTHERLSTFPIPKVDFDDPEQRDLYKTVVDGARRLLSGETPIGGADDMKIDVALRSLWGLTADDGLYINLELAQVPEGQVLRDLFPNGLPRHILTRAAEAVVTVAEPTAA